MNDLLPCPFCGNGARLIKREVGIRGRANFDWWHGIQCAKCNASVGYDDNRYRDISDAKKAWNTRATPTTTPLSESAPDESEVQNGKD